MRITKNYCCMDCGGLVSNQSALYGRGRCSDCYLFSDENPWRTNTNWKNNCPTCEICGKKLSNMNGRKCKVCYCNQMNGKNHPRFKGGRDRNYPNCIDCGKKLTGQNCIRCRECYRIWQGVSENNPMYGKSQELSPNWQNGISFFTLFNRI